MKITPRGLLATLLTLLALKSAALGAAGLAPAAGAKAALEAPPQLAQSTSAILEARAA